jgi:hypothetical protein
MGDVVLLLGNPAPRQVHKPDVAEDGSLIWHPHARGELVEDWKGRGPHRIHALEPDQSPHTELVVHADTLTLPWDELRKRLNRDVEHLWDYHSTEGAGYAFLVADGGDPEKAEQIRSFLDGYFGVPTPKGPVALVTNAGLDYASKQLGGAASASAIAKYVAITATAITPAAGDTTLSGEITTAGGGLVRAAAMYAHTAAASTYTLTITLTANGSDTLPVTIKGAGIFDASSTGNLVFEDTVSPNITYNASGDAGTLTETVTV